MWVFLPFGNVNDFLFLEDNVSFLEIHDLQNLLFPYTHFSFMRICFLFANRCNIFTMFSCFFQVGHAWVKHDLKLYNEKKVTHSDIYLHN